MYQLLDILLYVCADVSENMSIYFCPKTLILFQSVLIIERKTKRVQFRFFGHKQRIPFLNYRNTFFCYFIMLAICQKKPL